MIQPPAPDSRVAEISATMTHLAISTAASPTAVETTTPTPDAGKLEETFKDDFNIKLEPGWEWLNERPESWSMSNVPGSLQIQAEAGYINLGTAKNVFLRNVPKGDFMAETSINFLPRESDQFAEIVLLESEKNYIQAGLGYCIPEVGCVRQGFYIDIYKNGKFTLPRHPTIYLTNSLSVRLVVQNDTLSIFTSPDGRVWYRTFEQPMDFKPVQIGLFAGQNNSPLIIPATFGYFEITTLEK